MKPLTIFFISSFALALLFFLFRIAIFDGELVFVNGMQTIVQKTPMSLSYFIGIGLTEADLEGVISYRLLPSGYLLALAIIIGIPGLIAYRIHLGRTKNKNS